MFVTNCDNNNDEIAKIGKIFCRCEYFGSLSFPSPAAVPKNMNRPRKAKIGVPQLTMATPEERLIEAPDYLLRLTISRIYLLDDVNCVSSSGLWISMRYCLRWGAGKKPAACYLFNLSAVPFRLLKASILASPDLLLINFSIVYLKFYTVM